MEETCESLEIDAPAYHRLMPPLVDNGSALFKDVLAPPHFPKHPLVPARFGWNAWHDMKTLAEGLFKATQAKALFAAVAAKPASYERHNLNLVVDT